jgi:hypothetical protein
MERMIAAGGLPELALRITFAPIVAAFVVGALPALLPLFLWRRLVGSPYQT